MIPYAYLSSELRITTTIYTQDKFGSNFLTNVLNAYDKNSLHKNDSARMFTRTEQVCTVVTRLTTGYSGSTNSHFGPRIDYLKAFLYYPHSLQANAGIVT
jgi:hypothetical protein